jgi:hypothetical protein
MSYLITDAASPTNEQFPTAAYAATIAPAFAPAPKTTSELATDDANSVALNASAVPRMPLK